MFLLPVLAFRISTGVCFSSLSEHYCIARAVPGVSWRPWHASCSHHNSRWNIFTWQDDIIGVARFVDACLESVYTSAGLPVGDQASDQLLLEA